ncbi:MAG: hypothetical protein ACTSSP_01105 [Candidatus Asgardarchaeia archaeon]
MIQYDRYRTSKYHCQKLGIKNIQLKSQEGTDDYKECVKKFPDLKVVGYNKRHCELINKIDDESSLYSTGMASILFATYFNPKNIYIIGVDFYNRNVKPYFAREEHDLPKKKGAEIYNGFREGMIKTFYHLCDAFPNINFHLYTTFRKIRSNNNINVIYV